MRPAFPPAHGSRNYSMYLRSGTKLILLYMLLAYLAPAILVNIAGVPWIYREVALNWVALAVLLLALGAYLMLGNFPSSAGPIQPQKLAPRYTFRFPGTGFQISVLLVLVVIAALGLAGGVSGFRYSETGLSDRGSPLTIAFALVPTILQFFLLVYLFYDTTLPPWSSWGQMVKKALLATGLLLSANGIATLLVATLGLLHLVSPETTRNFLFRRTGASGERRPGGFYRGARMLSLALLFALLAAGAWIAGEATKRGEISSVIDLILSDTFLQFTIEWLVLRLSPSYVSLVAALEHYTLAPEWRVIADHLMAPVGSFLFRLNFLVMNLFDVARPQEGSLARINYLLITANDFVRDREGTSPGLLPGFLYSFPFPLNFIVLIGYLLVLQQFATRMINGMGRQMTAIGWAVFLIFMLPMFASPIDFLLIIDDGLISALLLVLLAYSCIRRTAGHRN